MLYTKEIRLEKAQSELIEILKYSQNQLHQYLKKYLKLFYSEENMFFAPEFEDDFIICRGSAIALVAHLDTVHKRQPTEDTIVFDKEKELLMCPYGIGGDDRNGVFAILEILHQCKEMDIELPTVIFTKDEEIGCIGATSVIMNFDAELLNLHCMIELDRRGYNDSVYYDCGNKEFKKYINSFGFIEKQGSFSDISVLSEAFPVAMVNLSIGYYNEHSDGELIALYELFSTIEKVLLMLSESTLYDKKFDLESLLSKDALSEDIAKIRGQLSYWNTMANGYSSVLVDEEMFNF